MEAFMRTRFRFIAPLIVVLLALPACGGQPASVQECKSFLWKVSSESATVYLLGSVHALNDDIYPLAETIEAAYGEAELMVFEVDMGEMQKAGLTMLARGTLGEGSSLADVVSADTYELAAQHLEEAGLPMVGFERMKPWMLALTITSLELLKAGFSADNGIDLHFHQRAEKDGKEQIGLETVDYQIGLFDNLDAEQSEAFLRYSLEDLDQVLPLLDKLTGSWKTGNASELEAILTQAFDEYPELYETIVTERNIAWMAPMEELLAGERVAMVVVGALHLVGEKGLVEQLRGRGYEVEQL
jgi:uncharacterized protein YbaP (TraB family)